MRLLRDLLFVISQVVPLMLTSAFAQQPLQTANASGSGNPSAWTVAAFASTIGDTSRGAWPWFSVGVFDPQQGERSLAVGAGPAWSPDGQTIAFCSDEDYLWRETMLRSASWGLGSSPLRSASWRLGSSPENRPRWGGVAIQQPAGLIVPSANYRSISLVKVDGTGLRKIAEAKSGQGMCEPSWSPDGKQIAYTIYNRRPKHSYIYIMDQDGGHSHLITEGYRPRWSPDGRRLTFFRAQHGPGSKSSVRVVNTDSTGLRGLTDDKVVSWTPTWTADGKIMFASNQQGASAIYEIDPDGTAPKRVVVPKDFGLEADFYLPQPSPDGQLIFVVQWHLGVQESIFLGIDTKSIFRLTNAGVIGADVALRWKHK